MALLAHQKHGLALLQAHDCLLGPCFGLSFCGNPSRKVLASSIGESITTSFRNSFWCMLLTSSPLTSGSSRQHSILLRIFKTTSRGLTSFCIHSIHSILYKDIHQSIHNSSSRHHGKQETSGGTWQTLGKTLDEACHATVTWLSFLRVFRLDPPLPSRERTCGLSCRWWPLQIFTTSTS